MFSIESVIVLFPKPRKRSRRKFRQILWIVPLTFVLTKLIKRFIPYRFALEIKQQLCQLVHQICWTNWIILICLRTFALRSDPKSTIMQIPIMQIPTTTRQKTSCYWRHNLSTCQILHYFKNGSRGGWVYAIDLLTFQIFLGNAIVFFPQNLWN